VPLSENEQRLLEQIERATYAEDPKFASAMRGVRRHPSTGVRMILGIVAVLVGLGLLVMGAAKQSVPVGVVGFVLMLAGTVYAVSAQRKPGPVGVVGSDGRIQTVRAKRKPTFMQRLETRWQRRLDER
jgi:hypothetical protein